MPFCPVLLHMILMASRNFNRIVERRCGTTIYTALALPFVLHMLRVYYAALCDDICEHRAQWATDGGGGCVENECSADNCGLIARVSVENDHGNGSPATPPHRPVLHLCESRCVRARGCFLCRVGVALCVITCSDSREGRVKQVFSIVAVNNKHVAQQEITPTLVYLYYENIRQLETTTKLYSPLRRCSDCCDNTRTVTKILRGRG